MILCVALYVLMLVNSIRETGNRNACDPLCGLVCVVVGKFDLGTGNRNVCDPLCCLVGVVVGKFDLGNRKPERL